MLNESLDNQIMSNIVEEIKKGIEKEKEFIKDYNPKDVFTNTLVSKIEDTIELFSMEKLENIKISQNDMPYNNYLPIIKVIMSIKN